MNVTADPSVGLAIDAVKFVDIGLSKNKKEMKTFLASLQHLAMVICTIVFCNGGHRKV